MPNFGDFNFGDDADSVDTDPIPDNNGPENESSSDGVQNDKTNYHEPGQGKQFEGGDVSEFATNTNPEEPSAQQDEIPPINIDPSSSSTSGKKRTRNSFQQSYADDELFYVDPIDDTVDSVVSFLSGKKKKTNGFVSRYAGRIDKVIDQWEKDNGIEQPEDARDITDFFRLLNDKSIWTENLLDYFTREERDRKARELGITSEELDETGYETNYESLTSYIDDYTDTTPWTTTLLEYFNNTRNQYSANLRADELLKTTIDIVSDSSIVESLLSNSIVEDELDVIIDTDDAESANNPTGIGELFDRTIISEEQGRELLGDVPLDDILGVPVEYSGLNLTGLEAFEDFIENSDLQVYIGDAVGSSYLNEFQDLGDPTLENWDGLL